MNNNLYTNNSLLIILFNANNLKNHVNELHNILHDNRLDIALITETHFTKHTYIFIPSYSLLKFNHSDNTAHGRVAILIKTNLKFYPLNNFSQNHIQSCTISVIINNISVVIAVIHHSPKYNITNFISMITFTL